MSGWTNERVDVLKAMWIGGIAASKIAAELGGITRNAVIGKAYRLGLPDRKGVVSPGRPAIKAPAPPVVAAPVVSLALPPYVAPPKPDPILGAKTLLDREKGECAWPLAGVGADTLYCCAAAKGRYCVEHTKERNDPQNPGKVNLWNRGYGIGEGAHHDMRHNMDESLNAVAAAA